MIIKTDKDLEMLKASGQICAYIRDKVADYLEVGMSTLEADEYAASLFKETGFVSAPVEIYKFPGSICLSVNACVAHGVPKKDIIIKDGDSVNVDVCGSLDGYYTDCGKSVVVGKDTGRQAVCDTARDMLYAAIATVTHKSLLRHSGRAMERLCRKRGCYPIKKLTGHGIGKTLHESPQHIPCHNAVWDSRRFTEGMVVALESFVSTTSTEVSPGRDGWSWISPKNAFTAQFEHTIAVTGAEPIILTEKKQ